MPISQSNKASLCALRVRKEQQGFIESVEQCLNEAAALSLWRPVALYDKAVLVGFAMYGLWKNEGENGRVWLDRFLIDASFQGKGYGKSFLKLLIARICCEYHCSQLFLSVYASNTVAFRLYQASGFVPNGEYDLHGEQIMVLQL